MTELRNTTTTINNTTKNRTRFQKCNAAIILLPRPPHPGIGGADAGLFASCSLNNFAPGSGDTQGDSLLLSKLVRAQFLNCTCNSDIIFHSKWPLLRLVRSEFGTFPEGKKLAKAEPPLGIL